jgi:uncharacterized protein (TIGR02266 family)
MFLPGSNEPLEMVAEVVHITPPEIAQQRGWDPGMGLHFVDYEETAAKRLEQYIEEQVNLKPEIKDERREHNRSSTLLKLRFPDLATLVGNYAKDISQGGIFIPTNDPKPVGIYITLPLVQPDSGEELEIMGKVERVVTEKEAQEQKQKHLVPGMGIKFINLDSAQRQALKQFLVVEPKKSR